MTTRDTDPAATPADTPATARMAPGAAAPAPTPVGPPSTLPWPPMLMLGLALAALVLGQAAPITWPGTDDIAARVIGLSIGAGGIALAVWAVTTLQRANTTVLPHHRASALVTTGPYARFRNPIYIADVMLLLGIAELSKNIWFVVAAAVFVPLVTWLAILPEERHLAARFGDEWHAYAARSRRWL